MRSGLVYSMNSGQTFCISASRTEPKWQKDYNNSELFPSQEIFDFTQFHNKSNYMKIVREDENKSMSGTEGNFSMDDDFKFVLLYSYMDDEKLQRVMQNVGNLKSFRVCIVEKPNNSDFVS